MPILFGPRSTCDVPNMQRNVDIGGAAQTDALDNSKQQVINIQINLEALQQQMEQSWQSLKPSTTMQIIAKYIHLISEIQINNLPKLFESDNTEQKTNLLTLALSIFQQIKNSPDQQETLQTSVKLISKDAGIPSQDRPDAELLYAALNKIVCIAYSFLMGNHHLSNIKETDLPALITSNISDINIKDIISILEQALLYYDKNLAIEHMSQDRAFNNAIVSWYKNKSCVAIGNYLQLLQNIIDKLSVRFKDRSPEYIQAHYVKLIDYVLKHILATINKRHDSFNTQALNKQVADDLRALESRGMKTPKGLEVEASISQQYEYFASLTKQEINDIVANKKNGMSEVLYAALVIIRTTQNINTSANTTGFHFKDNLSQALSLILQKSEVESNKIYLNLQTLIDALYKHVGYNQKYIPKDKLYLLQIHNWNKEHVDEVIKNLELGVQLCDYNWLKTTLSTIPEYKYISSPDYQDARFRQLAKIMEVQMIITKYISKRFSMRAKTDINNNYNHIVNQALGLLLQQATA